MNTQEAMKLALEALELNNAEWKALADSGDSGRWKAEDQSYYKQTEQALTVIKEALAQPEQEPVAWMRQDGKRVTTASDRHNYPDYETRYLIPLYIHPPQRTWVGLTAAQRKEIERQSVYVDGAIRMTEAKLNELNK
jgi:hypothetical protein